MFDPLVSVVLPVRNGSRFLTDAIESVLAQTYPHIELIVVDGDSSDGSDEIAQSYEDVIYVRQSLPPDEDGWRGLPDAWNLGITRARGPLIAFLSADDRWLSKKIATQVALLDRDDACYSTTMFRFFLEPGYAVPPSFRAELFGQDLVGRIPETLLARRRAFDEVGLFDTRYSAAQDVDWFLRSQEMGLPASLVSQVLVEKRVHDSNLASNAVINSPALLEVLGRSIKRRRDVASSSGTQSEHLG